MKADELVITITFRPRVKMTWADAIKLRILGGKQSIADLSGIVKKVTNEVS